MAADATSPEFDRDLAVVGAGRIGLPWAAVIASTLDRSVTCVDVDPDRVDAILAADPPFAEPGLEGHLQTAVETGALTATTDTAAVADHRTVAFAINARRNRMSEFVDVIREYGQHLAAPQVVVNRTTVPVDILGRLREAVADAPDGAPSFVCFPERLAEGKAIDEIESLPKIVGVDDRTGEQTMRSLLGGLDCPLRFTDPETAMFVKLIDNAYRDAVFAISNQIAFTADQLGLDAHEAIELANDEYPRNDIPDPGTVGGKCLPKDPHFLTDERVCDQPTTPDLFNATRRTNASLQSYITTELLRRQPDKTAMLGLTYKPGVGDVYNSPATDIRDALRDRGITVVGHDPAVDDSASIADALGDADVVVLAVPHEEFDGVEGRINELSAPEAVVYDVWGLLDPASLSRRYEGFGIKPRPSPDAASR